ncbi:hypothetical protein, partial [Streptococcus sp. DD10]|uniref:hypothetical protein n=1 Tax=Streptococcus sp. DD10 TaxID=1777878 RepID=UPI00082D21C2
MEKKQINKVLATSAVTLAAGTLFGMQGVAADTVENVEVPAENQATTAAPQAKTHEEAKADYVAAESEVSQAQAVYEKADQEVQQVQSALSQATKAQGDASSVISNTQEAIAQTEVEKETAQKTVAAAQTAVAEATAQNPEIATELTKAEATAMQASSKVAETEKSLEMAKSISQQAQDNYRRAESASKTAATDLASKQQELIANQTAVSQAETAVTTAQSLYDSTVVSTQAKLAELTKSVQATGENYITSTKSVTIDSIDGSAKVEATKDSQHEAVLYDGTRTRTIEISAEQLREYRSTGRFTYTPNTEAISRYMVTMLKELRRLNGITIPVPEVSQEALRYAQARAEEMLKNNKLSHDTLMDKSIRNSENAARFGYTNTSGSTTAILSDEQMAYHLLNSYFADYENVYSGSGSVNYGHRISLLTAYGDGLGNGFAGAYHAMDFLDIAQDTTFEESMAYWDVMGSFTYEGINMYRNGQRLKFLPRTTFNYIATYTETSPNTAKEAAQAALTAY